MTLIVLTVLIAARINLSSPGVADVALLSAGDKVRAGSPATASWMQVALGLSQPFVTEPWIRA